MRRKPTIREVAQFASVSPTTVSHVINNTRFVSPELRLRVDQAMQELGYQPNALARSLRRGQTHTLGLILPDSSNPFFAEIGHSIEASAFEVGYNMILCNTEGDLERERIYVELLSTKQVDGVIFVASGDQTDMPRVLLHGKIPLVAIDRELPDLEVDTVMADNRAGGYLATRHLIEHGHRRIGCISGPSNLTPSAERVTGYREALTGADLPVDESLILRGDFHPCSGQQAMEAFLRLPEPPSAVFACNDLMAIGAVHAATTAGLRVPGDLAIVGFDDIELASYTAPPLTTIAQPKKEMGQAAVQLLLDRIENRTIPARSRSFETNLVTRESCGEHP